MLSMYLGTYMPPFAEFSLLYTVYGKVKKKSEEVSS